MKKSQPTIFRTLVFALAICHSLGFAQNKVKPALEVEAQLSTPVLIKDSETSQKVVIKIDVTGAEMPEKTEKDRVPLNVAVVLDRSGSMSGSKIAQAREAAQLVVDHLNKDDIFSLVTYDTEVTAIIPASKIGKQRGQHRNKIKGIVTGGSTALYAGVQEGAKQAQAKFDEEYINRIILLSDGKANVGPSSNKEISALGKKYAKKDISVTTIGLGSAYNEDLMTSLAEASDANYYYVENTSDLSGVFADELGELQSVVAREIKIKIKFPKGVKPVRILGRNDGVNGQVCDIKLATLASQQNREILVECEVGSGSNTKEIANIQINYANELADAASTQVEYPMLVTYTESKEEAKKACNKEVVADAQVWGATDMTQQAIRYGDAGDTANYNKVLTSQIATLKEVQTQVSVQKQAVIQQEIDDLEQARSTGPSNKSRKTLYNRIFSRKNAK